MCLTPFLPLSIRVYSQEDAAPTVFSNSGAGQNRQSVLVIKKHGKRSDKRMVSTAVLDRCGNNWKNGKGGCGILMMEEVSPCMATMFLPFVLRRIVKN